MLYNILYPLSEYYAFLNIFKYLTFRGMGAVFTSFVIALYAGPYIIKKLRWIQKKGQPIRKEGPESHLKTKQGTPTMGGAIILLSMTLSTLIWADLANPFVWIVLGTTLSFGLIGGIDDFIKISRHNAKGMFSKTKFLLQLLLSLGASLFITHFLPSSMNSHIALPLIKDIVLNAGVLFIPFCILVITGSSNAVNLTDGLDGLATGPIIIAAGVFSIIAYIVGNSVFSHYLQISFVPGAGELSVLCGTIIGAGLGFLWFNAPPAQVFMGDMGSLAMGAALGSMSIITKHEIVLFIIGGLFVIETISVILQVVYFKMTGGKRIFLMAPLHHHFEKKGWSESTVVIRFWIISLILALIGLSTLKLR